MICHFREKILIRNMALAEPVKKDDRFTKKHKKRNTKVKGKTVEQIKKETIELKLLSKEILVTPDFIEENKKLCQTIPKLKKGGPYSKLAKKSRRDEVFRLHFDCGYSSRKIAEMMNFSRNTINSDVGFWYSQLQKQDDKVSFEDWYNKLLYRLEAQRARFVEKLAGLHEIREILLVEKMIFDLDSRIVQTITKVQTSKQYAYDKYKKMVNQFLKEKGIDERFTLWGDLVQITSETDKKILELFKLDKNQRNGNFFN